MTHCATKSFPLLVLPLLMAVLFSTTLTFAADSDDLGDGGNLSVSSPVTVAPGSLNPARQGLNLRRNAKVMIVPLNDAESTRSGMIDEWQANFISRRLKRAQAEKYDLVVLEIDTHGGVIGACEQINKAIANCSVPVIAYVSGTAFSGGALISLGCKMIVVSPSPSCQIGGAKAVDGSGGDIPGVAMNQKIDSYMRAMVSNLSQANHHPEPLAIGMVNSSVEVYEIADPVERFVTGERLAELERQRGAKPSIVHQWKKAGTILTLTGTESVNTGFASGKAASYEELFTGLNIQPAQTELASVTASEKAARFLGNPIWRVLLVLIGLVALFWEMKSPGHGIGYLTFAFCLGLFFWLQIFANNAGLWEIALFGSGALLVAMELFLLGGFGFMGFVGFGMILASIVCSFLPEGVTLSTVFGGKDSGVSEWDRQRALNAMMWSAVTLASICLVVLTALVKGVKLPVLNRLALNATITGTCAAPEHESHSKTPERSEPHATSLVGKIGVAETVLKPFGKVRLEGVTHDALSEGSMLEAGQAVVVLAQQGLTLVVRAVAQGQGNKPA